MLRLVLTVAILALALPSHADLLDSVVSGQIAVEQLTGRGGGSEFSGWIGSFSLNQEGKLISISEFANIRGKVVIVNGNYKITKYERYDRNIYLECIDIALGIEWIAKIWLTDDNKVRIEMTQKQSSRKWVNLGKYGMGFIEKNNLKHLNFGAQYNFAEVGDPVP